MRGLSFCRKRQSEDNGLQERQLRRGQAAKRKEAEMSMSARCTLNYITLARQISRGSAQKTVFLFNLDNQLK